ncbi:transcription factor IIIB 50 kDa subunit [Synchiropus splendidus]|uniref:transcription factor IIIB 50 kDa subunit n=1 Tax=Synchiropus splendidus TaxID=270530 RepID=UPI00237DA5D6|nr:transcription factor IIIB 50 kDa subunit [Synchiropus splendidus]
MTSTCSNCGSTNVVEDDLYAQNQLVCADCGLVVSEGILTGNPSEGTDVSYAFTSAATKKPCLNLKKGVLRVQAICRTLRLNQEIEEHSIKFFKQTYQHEKFINVLNSKKDILGGCCILLSCRLLNWPVSMGTIACMLDSDAMTVAGVYQDMVQVANVTSPFVSITTLIEAHCVEYKLGSDCVAEEFAESTRSLAKRTEALLELAADTWIVTGRKPIFIMMAAVYLAWQSLNPTRNRLKVTLSKFCKMARVNKLAMALTRVAEIKEVLVKLGKEIPWARQPVTPDNVVELVEDILKHRTSLLFKALRRHEDTSDTEDGLEKPSELDQGNESAPSVAESEQDVEKSGESTSSTDSRCKWGKRLLFAPPCVAHPKKRRVEQQHPLVDVTGDEDISDSEIDSYIRTPQEISDFSRAQKILNQQN